MTSNNTTPTLAELQSEWDAELKASYPKHFRMAVLTAVLILPPGVWFLHTLVGWHLALIAGLTHLNLLPWTSRLPAKMTMRPRPTQESFDENQQIREAVAGRRVSLAKGKDNAVEVDL
jgi:hypothetical protein